MSNGGYYAKKPKGPDIDITVTIRYHGLKATQYFSKFDDQSIAILRQDLLVLKVPHPKAENIVFLSHGCLEFSWFGIESYGVLHNNLTQKLRPKAQQAQEALQSLLQELSITSVNIRETPLTTAPYVPNAKSRPNPSIGPYAYAPTASPLTWVPVPNPKKRPNPFTTVPEQPAKIPKSGPSASSLDAEQFLNETLGALRPPKAEPVEATLPPASLPQPAPVLRFAQTKPSPRIELPQWQPPSPPFAPLSMQSKPPSLFEALHAPPVSAPAASVNAPSSATLSTSGSLAAVQGPGPRSEDVSVIQALTRELWDLRGRISGDISRENAIIEELKDRKAAFVPQPSQYGGNSREVNVLKTRLEALTQELEAERKLRHECEAALSDAWGEIKQPFMIPPLINALISISKLTSKITSTSNIKR